MKVINQIAHVLMQAPLFLIFLFPLEIWPYMVNAFWFAFWREDATHRIGKKEGWGWIFKGSGRWWDIFWGMVGGALLGAAIFLTVRWTTWTN